MRGSDSESNSFIDITPAFNTSVSLVVLVACSNLAGIAFNLPWMRSLLPDSTAMKGVTSVCLTLLASSVFLIKKGRTGRWWVLTARFPVYLVLVICLLTIFIHLYHSMEGIEPGISNLAFTGLFLSPDSRMTLITAVIALVAGTVIFFLPARSRPVARFTQLLTFCILIVSYLMLTSHILQVHSIHTLNDFRMAAGTSLAFTSLCVALFCLNSDTWFMRVYLGRSSGSVALRRLLPGLLFLPLVIGWSWIWAERTGWISSEVGVALGAMAYTFCFIILAGVVAKSVNRLDEDRRIATEAIRSKEMEYQKELQRQVEQRTAQLHQTMSELAFERERFQVVLDRLPAFVMLMDSEYNMVFANKKFIDTFGEPVRKKCYQCLFGRQEPCEICGASEAFLRDSPYTWDWTGPDGRIYHISDYGYYDSDGSRMILEMGLDVTEERNVEKYVLGKVIESEEMNRKRFSSDLHDDLGPILSAIRLQIGMLDQESNRERLKETVANCEDLLTEAIEKMRAVANNLMPGVIEKFGLEAAVNSFINRIGSEGGFSVDFQSDLGETRLEMEHELHLYRIICELINNTIRHSGSKRAELTIRRSDREIEIVYSDNGKGYGPVTTPASYYGMGLQNISNRVSLMNGKLLFLDRRGKTGVRITVPQKISK